MTLGNLITWPYGHGCIFGSTGSGKSTLEDAIINESSITLPNARILVIDTKMRYRCDYELNGMTTGFRYRNLRGGGKLRNSVRLPLGAHARDLKRAWDSALGNIVVAQTDEKAWYPWLDYLLKAHYKQSDKKHWNLSAVDEALHFTRDKKLAEGLITTTICGRERGNFALICSQRPRWIPVESMTEMSSADIFTLDYAQDIEHLVEMGLPEDIQPPPPDYSFLHFNKRRKPRIVTAHRLGSSYLMS